MGVVGGRVGASVCGNGVGAGVEGKGKNGGGGWVGSKTPNMPITNDHHCLSHLSCPVPPVQMSCLSLSQNVCAGKGRRVQARQPSCPWCKKGMAVGEGVCVVCGEGKGGELNQQQPQSQVWGYVHGEGMVVGTGEEVRLPSSTSSRPQGTTNVLDRGRQHRARGWLGVGRQVGKVLGVGKSS